ncbi:uncharacterized protein BXZ73DRAFT_42698 [Epithele typhae]|uniref:uncharacterized protein n=1 Tax=Epithele typhae TaxID=378194 RepID=UPI002008A89C|nr:uncharacterized protein BXZ73DRAFT_42698 [Epithele typhae]KAH9940487.1 hypothetical protein BXZ73DRAFT_42698 [Epithele typhae]
MAPDIARPSSSARRSTTGIPPKPDASLAEWTSKIKAMQKQVDEDEEAETRRLEMEIQASRIARMRRSTNLGSRTNSVDLSQSGTVAALKEVDRSPQSNDPLALKDRQSNQDDALRKLMGDGSPKMSATTTTSPPSTSSTSSYGPAAAKRGAEPISLAAFMGGRATGPRLTKHAPQQDAHDPTQFEQRTHVAAPHPVFGRGGVAMPGMTGSGSVSAQSRAIRDEEARSTVSTSSTASTKGRYTISPSTPATVRSMVAQAQERESPTPSYTSTSQVPARQRTISTPSVPPSPVKPTTPKPSTPAETFTTKPKADIISRPSSKSPNHTIIRPITPRTSTGTKSPSPYNPQTSNTTKSMVALPGLARPIQPSPRSSIGSPQMPPSHNPSPAFLKPPQEKGPTPSLSRLKGRGFVKNMVEKSAALENIFPPEVPPLPERILSPTKRQSTGAVLDRWQPVSTPSPPPVVSPKPSPMRKSLTTEPAQVSPTTATYTVPLKRENTAPATVPTLSKKSSMPTMKPGEQPVDPNFTGWLGSSKTVITYVEPTKTGEQQHAPLSEQRTEVDELGMRVRPRTTSGGLVQERGEAGMPAAGKPLSHPTKDRAKKPRKGKGSIPTTTLASSTLDTVHEAPAARSALQTRSPAGSQKQPSVLSQAQTSSPTSQYPSPPASHGRAVSPAASAPAPAPCSTPFPTTSSASDKRTPPVGALPTPFGAPRGPGGTGAQPPPVRQRIPSTGNRARVMEVAQAFSEEMRRQAPASPQPPASPEQQQREREQQVQVQQQQDQTEEDWTPPSVKNMVATWGPRATVQPHAYGASGTNGAQPRAQSITAPPLEKRKSSYERYSQFIMPPLQEEKTPAPSPVSTLKKDAAAPDPALLESDEDGDENPESAERKPLSFNEYVQPVEDVVVDEEVVQPSKDETVHLAFEDKPLPRVDVEALHVAPRPRYTPDPDINTVSVEVMSIETNNTTPISNPPHIFHDTELLAIVHRAKAKSSGLVTTRVWAWQGRRAQPSERALQRITELARRYNTSAEQVKQAREPVQLVGVLGGTLVVRQGARAHWSAENTAMHRVQSRQGLVFIDELEIGVKNLCSGFSYCVSILETFYVWHGRGAVPTEQAAALAYAQSLAPSPDSIVELTEAESELEDMFWMVLGEGDYARADYWRWRAETEIVDPRVWVVDASRKDTLLPVPVFPAFDQHVQSVFLVDCVWEFFVLVGQEARHKRSEIRLAISVAESLAQKVSPTRPFKPVVHVLVFPTRIPTDLLLTFRELEEAEFNAGDVPNHMNLIPNNETDTKLKMTSWSSAELRDPDMLPLGVCPSDVS